MHDKILYVRSMNDNDIFLTVNGMREPDKLCAVGDEYLGMGMVTSRNSDIRFYTEKFVRLTPCLISNDDNCFYYVNHEIL